MGYPCCGNRKVEGLCKHQKEKEMERKKVFYLSVFKFPFVHQFQIVDEFQNDTNLELLFKEAECKIRPRYYAK